MNEEMVSFGWVAAGRVSILPESQQVSLGDFCMHVHESPEGARLCGGKERPHILHVENVGQDVLGAALDAAMCGGYHSG